MKYLIEEEEYKDLKDKWETAGFWKAIDELYKAVENGVTYRAGPEVSGLQMDRWNTIINLIKKGKR